MILAITAAFVAGSIGTGTIAYAGDDDDASSLLCDAGKALTGIVFGDDDDGPTQIFCAELGGGGVSVTGFYVEQDQALQNLGTSAIIIEKQIILENEATVFVSSNVPIFPGDTGDKLLHLVVDGTVVQKSFTRNTDGFRDWMQHNLSWTGNLEPGPHTIQIKTADSPGQVARFNCAGIDACNLSILVFE